MERIIIKKVRIDRIWDLYNVEFLLDDDVNILVGDNGIGKTTVLDIINSVLCNGVGKSEKVDKTYMSATVQFTDGYSAHVQTGDDGKKKIIWMHNDVVVDYEDVPVLVDVVSSFDSVPFSRSMQEKLRSEHDDITSELDMLLYEQLSDYYRYRSMISTRYRQLTQNKEYDEANNLYEPLDKAETLCNELFDGKTWHEDEETGTLMFKVNANGTLLKV